MIKNHREYLVLKKFFENDNIIQQGIIIAWLSQAKVHFIPSTKLLKEILRFLSSTRGGHHIFYQQWVLRKKQGLASIELKNHEPTKRQDR